MRRVALAFLFISSLGLSVVPPESEGLFSRATLAIQEKSFEEANQHLDELLKLYPVDSDCLELKALTEKSLGNLESARNIYQTLYENALTFGVTQKRAFYSFELGNIYYGLKDTKTAGQYLRKSIRDKFNVEASHFILGKIDIEQNDWAKSREHFEAASKAEAFRSAAKLYIAQTYLKENRATDALSAYVDAKESALSEVENGELVSEQARFLAQQVLKNSEQELRSYNKSEWIKEVGLATAYDSNVLFMPNVGDAATTATTGSIKQAVNWKLRYASNPTAPWQYLGGYQGSVNYNFNQDTQGGQFFVHDLSNFVTRGFLKTTQYGFKVGGTGILQYQTDAYKPFNLTGSFGPFAKTPLSDNWTLGAEAFFQPNRNFLDPNLPSASKRSGWDQVIRTYLSSRQSTPYWTPSLFLTTTLMRPEGSDFSGTRVNMDFANAMYLSSSVFLAQTVGLSAAWYPNRSSGQRTDQGFSMGLSSGYQITKALALMAQLDFTQNLSSDANFRYNRWSSTLTGNYRF